MTEKDHSKQTTRQDSGKWIAYGVVLVGAVCTVIGILILSWTPKTPPAAAAPPLNTPVTQSTLLILTPQTRSSATRAPTQAVAATRTPPPQVTPATPTPVPLTSGLFHLVIVHSNDTWGYTLPCG